MCDDDGKAGWRPRASLQVLQLRAQVLHYIRQFFQMRQVLEVETPLLCSASNPDPHIESFTTVFIGPQAAQGVNLYLQRSPEFAMKRLLSAGIGPVYQICKAFRQGEHGRQHNPEFTILEWYRPGFDVTTLIAEIEALLLGLFTAANKSLGKTQIISYQQAFESVLGLDPLVAPVAELIGCTKEQGIDVRGLSNQERDAWLDLLMSHTVQPRLGQNHMTFVTNYPVSQAALACVNPVDGRTAERFELFINGVELANGFHELSNADEQRHRFEKDLQLRAQSHQPPPPIDKYLLQALEYGLPDCSGVAVGLDRVIMLLAEVDSIGEVLAFPMGRI